MAVIAIPVAVEALEAAFIWVCAAIGITVVGGAAADKVAKEVQDYKSRTDALPQQPPQACAECAKMQNENTKAKEESAAPADAPATSTTASSGGAGGGDDDDPNNSKHAKQRMGQRKVSQERVDEAKNIGREGPGNKPDTIVKEVSASESASGRGIRVVINEITGRIITVIDMGSKFISKLP